ncbi:hypothetical protein FORC085_930 [Bacillus cereus]|nr:hypothetical protein FORC085_930 [Bacillus cereus]
MHYNSTEMQSINVIQGSLKEFYNVNQFAYLNDDDDVNER